MFIITHNNNVILGPMRWNRFRFENQIKEELEIEVTLPQVFDADVLEISTEVKIYRVVQEIQAEFNQRTQFLNGPFWQFTDNGAIANYMAENLSVDAVKNQMKSQVAAERYAKEISGVKIALQDKEVTIDTSRGNRDIFAQKYLLMGDADAIQWKFPECWLTLSKMDLGAIVQAGANHVQAAFDWESAKIVEVDGCSTLDQLNSIVISDSATGVV